ncbi:MAG: tyrosine-type recombinase/integrase [Pseudoxanthomonas sp.]
MLYLEWRENGKPVRTSTRCRELEPAKRKARELILEFATVRDTAPEDAPIASVLDRYYLRHGRKLASAETAKRAIDIWKAFFPTEVIADLQSDRQRAFLAKMLEDGLSIGYARRVLGVGKAAFNLAWQDNEIRQVPFIRLPPIGSGYPHYARFEQLVAFLNTPMPDHLFTYTMIRLNTGARGDATRDLQPFQIDWHTGLIELNPPGRQQTKKFRPVVPLTKFLQEYLTRLPATEFYVMWHGKWVKSVRTTWNAVRVDAGLPTWFSAKILRHTVGTELRRRGVPGWDVSGQLGHKKGESAPTTENYAKFDPDYLAKAKNAFDDWMVELAAKVPRMRDATAMTPAVGPLPEEGTETLAVTGFPVVGGTGFEPVTPTMSR